MGFPKGQAERNGERGRPACLLLRHSASSACQKNWGEDVKNPKNHFRPFCSGNLLSSKPFEPKSHKTIFRIFRKIFGGYRGEGVADFILHGRAGLLGTGTSGRAVTDWNRHCWSRWGSTESHPTSCRFALSRSHAVGAQESTQSRHGAKAQNQTRPELPDQIQTDSKRFKPIQTKKKLKCGPQHPTIAEAQKEPKASLCFLRGQEEGAWLICGLDFGGLSCIVSVYVRKYQRAVAGCRG
jgi:hypothetical protein